MEFGFHAAEWVRTIGVKIVLRFLLTARFYEFNVFFIFASFFIRKKTLEKWHTHIIKQRIKTIS